MQRRVVKRKRFARWQACQRLTDVELCHAIGEMERGLVDARLGGDLYKKRVARPHSGKRDGFRVLISARMPHRAVFLEGFAKSDVGNINNDELLALKHLGQVLLNLMPAAFDAAIEQGILLEIECDEQDH
ncbi:type II toxin-antitoxin system RelE/ParE family toxin [Pigmentiphaga litoralis]|uniref:type II toxin-antitoxin system RelE/ParE family toxin n=1 Tax=Pigmentiphaga litoralis TaxID=516702 RepID=UPI003B429CF0